LLRALVLLLLWFGSADGRAADPTWLRIDTDALTLSVMRGAHAALTFEDIAIGRFGATAAKRRGDDMTPIGMFRITDIRASDAFHRFVALDYPSRDRAREALAAGLIDDSTHARIVAAHRGHRAPPQDTVLGGHIGIHGLGRGDPEIHAALNWTQGCIALTDAQIDRLLPWLRLGMPVEIR
jgi:hypothetical protein